CFLRRIRLVEGRLSFQQETTVQFRHVLPSCHVMPDRLVAGALDFESGYGRSNRSPATSSLTISEFPLRPMAGRCALNAEIVVRVHGREPELWSIGRMADRLSAGTGSTPVSSAISFAGDS